MDSPRQHRAGRLVVGLLALLTLSGQVLEAERAPTRPVLSMALRGREVISVAPGGAAARAGILPGDRIVGVGPHAVPATGDPSVYIKHHVVGERVLLTLQRDRAVQAIEFPAPAPTSGDVFWRLAMAGAAILTLLIGVLVYFKKPRPLTLIFAGICLSMGYSIFPPFVPLDPSWLLLRASFLELFTVLTPPLLVHLFLLFPFRAPLLERRRWVVAWLYLPSVLLLGLFQASRVASAPMGDPPGGAGGLAELGHLFGGLIWLLGIGLALYLFVRSYRRARSDVSRAKVRVVLWGSVIALLPLAVSTLVHQIWPDTALPGEQLSVLGIVMIPLSFGYAIVRHGIFDATHLVRRSLAVTVMVVLILMAYFGANLALRELLLPQALLSPLWVSLLSLATAGLVFLAVQGPMQSVLMRTGGPQPRDQHTLLYDLGSSLRGVRDRGRLVQIVSEFLGEALRAERVAFFEPHPSGFLEACYLDGLTPEKLHRYHFSPQLSAKLVAVGAPTDRGDLETDLPFGYISGADQEVFEAIGAEFMIPLRSEESLTGLVFVGSRTLGEGYTPGDLRLAETIAAEGSIALENASFHAKALEDAAWRQEVVVAADLQQRLLPTEVPAVESLEISSFSMAADGVGGDYYDHFRTPWGEVVLAVADASGKSVSGAILMANLQGLVKGEALRREDPARITARINRRLSEMNKPERFVTFALARVDPLTGTLEYCNAGHLNPLLIRADGSVESLEEGGLPLGIRDQARYDGGRTRMRSGDLLLLFTDGITERRRGEDMYGQERLEALVRRHHRLSARAIQETVLEEVQNFAPTALDDDTTLLVVKML